MSKGSEHGSPRQARPSRDKCKRNLGKKNGLRCQTLYTRKNRCVKLTPWLLHRGHTSSNNIVRTAGAYKLQNLLYHLPTWGGTQGLRSPLLQGKLMEATTAHIPPGYVEAWVCMQKQFKDVQTNDTKVDFRRRQDAAAQALADLFENNDIALPFRFGFLLGKSRSVIQRSPACF